MNKLAIIIGCLTLKVKKRTLSSNYSDKEKGLKNVLLNGATGGARTDNPDLGKWEMLR